MGIGLGGIRVPGAVQATPSQHQPPQLPAEYLAQLAEQNRVKKLVNAYKASPESYSESEAMQLQQMAVGAGIPMEVKSSTGAKWGKGLLSMLDTATFGLLVPDDLYAPVNAEERKAVGWGSMAGMVLPWGGPFRLAGAGLKGLKGVMGAGKALKNPMVKNMISGFKNPMGVGKVLPGFGKTAAETTKAVTKEVAKKIPRIGKDFTGSMGKIIDVNKGGFWKAVKKGKTQAEKRKIAKGWIMQNMHKGDRGSKNMAARVEGWLAKKFPDPKKPLQLGAGAPRIGPGTRAGTVNEKGVIHMGSGDIAKKAKSKKPKYQDAEFTEGTGASKNIKEQLKMESIKKKIAKNKKTINTTKMKHKKGPKGKKVPNVVRLTVTERSFIRSRLSPKQLRRLAKHKKGVSRDRQMLQMAQQSGIV